MKTVFVTGASRGIGKEIARKMANSGYSVAFGYLKNVKAANSLNRELKTNNPNILPVKINLGSQRKYPKMQKK